MPGLTLYLSNRLENLADRLAQSVTEPIGSPLQPEIIIVQSRGMQRWISMELARRNGICANAAFPFPNTFLDSVFRLFFPDLPEISPFDPDLLSVLIMKKLPELTNRPEFAPLRRYLHDDPKQLKLYQLSDRIAGVFDQYMVFRPQLILDWQKNAERCVGQNRWQPVLWREIVRTHGPRHRTTLQKELLQLLSLEADEQALPYERVHMFGISYLPPFHLQAFAAMARVASVNIFLLNPCREYWADILDARDIKQITRQYTIAEETEAYYYLEQGNPLLASMGTLGRDFLSLVSDTDCDIKDCFSSVEGSSLLAGIQSDLLNLVDRRAPASATTPMTDQDSGQKGTGWATKTPGTAGVRDDSIQIHACHSPLREIEVLRDRLLAMFAGQPDLKPRDVVVMTPDIESYAPFIHAVFGTQLDPSTAIPYSIADQAARMTNELVEAFFQLLSVKDDRFTVSQVLSVLELARVKERFGLTRSDLERIARWIEDVNIRWGKDAQSRSAIGLPPMPANTWKQGLQRLLLGVAMPVAEQRLFAGILPGDLIEGQDGQVLGKLLDFLEQLFRLSDLLQQPCRPTVWQQRLSDMLERFFLIDQDTERQAHMIRQALETLGRMETVGTYDGEFSVEIIESHLEKCFRHSPHAGFLSRGVTFCAMLPMRSIPFQIVCLVGMNNEAIPRSQQALGFDLITRHPQTGDRSRRSDDKYLFLESILSARRTLYISYVGQSVEDNSAIPPSVLVSELTDYLREGSGIDELEMVIRHPLQAFSPRYFQGDDSELFSYSRENFEAVSSRGRRLAPGPFFSSPLKEPPPESRSVTLEQLCRFFQHPSRYLLQQRLSMRLEEPSAGKQDHEPFRLDGLERYQMAQMLLAFRESGFDRVDQYNLLKAAGNLPLGTVGETIFQDLKLEVEHFADRVESEMQAHRPRHRRVDLQIADFTIGGHLTDLYPRGRIQFRFAPVKAGDILTAWIRHLCLGHPSEDRTPFHSILVGRDVTWYLGPVERPEIHLDDLLQIYWQGMCAPLHFFPALSLDYFRQVFEKRREPADVMPALRRKWTGDDFAKGALDDPYVRRCFEGLDPLDDTFRQLAERIFRPVFAALENNP